MSLLLPDELRVVLAPDQLVLVRLAREFTRRGLVRRVLERTVVPCESTSGETPWAGAVTALETILPSVAKRRDLATLILSSHFTRFALVPWSDALSDEAEQMAYARHCFGQAYGIADGVLDIRLSPAPAGMPQLASAVDGRLLQAVRQVFSEAGVALRSVQPYLMAAYNNGRPRLQRRSAWFVLFEPGCLCLALLQQGRWASVRSMRINDDWREQLPQILDREACMGLSDTVPDAVFVWAPALENADLPDGGPWQMQYLKPAMRRGLLPEQEGRFAMALSG